MRRIITGLAVTLMAVTAGCGEPTSIDGALAGEWITEARDLSQTGWHQSQLVLTSLRTFRSEVRSYGLYGQATDQLSAFSRVEGVFEVNGAYIEFRPSRLVWWDSFYGVDSPQHVEEPYPWGSLFDDARYSVSGNALTIEYTTYPADAPLRTSVTYSRQ